MITDLRGQGATWWADKLFRNESWREQARRFVEGESSACIKMFNWSEAPQDSNFWSNGYNTDWENKKDLKEAQSFVRWLLRGDIEDDGEKT